MSDALDRLHPVLVHHIVNTLAWTELRPLQHAAVGPLLDGRDALLLAPTAGGKTEAAVFPLLSAMARERWPGLSVLYVCPLRALLNNLEPRLAGWVGLRAGVWHGDTGDAARRRMLDDPPEMLLTTPESLEGMLTSGRVDHRELFATLRAVVVDEVHAFAGDDRGWHLLAVLERLSRLAGRPLRRVGLSATVGNPDGLLRWLQGSAADDRTGVVIAPLARSAAKAEVGLDHVGGIAGAAKVIAALYQGEKRLVFCDSRRRVEELAVQLRGRGVETYVSHSSLALDERRRSERAFAEASNCVIVATSTLELGVDVGDLDRVIQIDAPATVAAFLQRLGRTGRRAGAARNCLFLATDDDGFDLAKQRSSAVRQIGAVLEGSRNVYWPMSAWENLMYFGRLKGLRGAQIKPRAEWLLTELGLWDRRKESVGTFSRGMQQKVAVAVALITDPPIILLDEPTLGLDVEAARTVKDWVILLARREGKTVVLTTHQLAVAQELSDRIAVIRSGRIIADLPTTSCWPATPRTSSRSRSPGRSTGCGLLCRPVRRPGRTARSPG